MIQNSTLQLEQTSDKTNITFLEENLVLLKNVLVPDLCYLTLSSKARSCQHDLREGPENETSTNDIVSKMTNFIKENSFELTFDGMNIKFTSLQVSRVGLPSVALV